LGFAGGCNLGITAVSSSKGAPLQPFDYLALVNKDATVTRGWLGPLVKVLDSSSDIGAAVPKILFAPRFIEVEVSRLIPDSPEHVGEQVCISGARLQGKRSDKSLVFDEGFGGPSPFLEVNGDEFSRWTMNGGRIRITTEVDSSYEFSSLSLRVGSRVPGWVKLRTEDDEYAAIAEKYGVVFDDDDDLDEESDEDQL
jgi:hypothetical protein